MSKSAAVLEKPASPSTGSRTGEVRLQDIARHLGVHPMTVSRALSGRGGISKATCESVRQAAEELGYRPNMAARSLRQGRNPKFVPLFSALLDSGVNTQKLERIQSLLSMGGYDSPIHSCGFHNQFGQSQLQLIGALRSQRPAAMICNTNLLSTAAREELRAWSKEGATIVTYDHDIEAECDCVVFDREDAGYQSARHLLDLGHTRIGYAHHSLVYGPDERLMGVKRAILEQGLTFPKEWVLRVDEPVKATVGGRELAGMFLALPVHKRPTAICLVNDLAAMGFMDELHKNGLRVPDDLSIVAHDDQPYAEFAATPLTVVTHPADEIAERVVHVLRNRIDEPATPRQRIEVRAELIQRASTAPY